MAVVILKHKVENYKKWEAIYNQDVQRRQNTGMKELTHGRDVDSPNEVYMIFETNEVVRARELMLDSELKELMEEAGVLGKPEMVIIEQ